MIGNVEIFTQPRKGETRAKVVLPFSDVSGYSVALGQRLCNVACSRLVFLHPNFSVFRPRRTRFAAKNKPDLTPHNSIEHTFFFSFTRHFPPIFYVFSNSRSRCAEARLAVSPPRTLPARRCGVHAVDVIQVGEGLFVAVVAVFSACRPLSTRPTILVL